MVTGIAQQYLDQYWDGTLPIDPERIARLAGIEVSMQPLGSASGTICLTNGIPQMAISITDHPLRQRFTMSHELGHFALGHLADGRQWRDESQNFSATQSNPKERQANQFAAALLMPPKVVRWLVVDQGINTMPALAKALEVSEVAMSYRLKNLGY